MNGGLRVWVEQCAVLVYGIRSLENWSSLGLREKQRERTLVSQTTGPGWRGLMTF